MKANINRALTKIQSIIIIAVLAIAAVSIGYYYITTLPSGTPGAQVVKIGMIYPLSGTIYRRVMRDAPEFFVNYLINDQGGIKSLGGAKVELVWGDCQASADLALSETERVITQNGVHMVIGSWYSSLTYATQEVSQRYNVSCFNTDSSSPTLVQRKLSYFFMGHATDDQNCKSIIEFLISSLEKKGLKDKVHTVAIIVENALFGQTTRTYWLKEIQAAKDANRIDWTIVEDISFTAPSLDLTTEILKLKSADPDLVLACPMAPSDCVKFVTAMSDQDWYPPIMATNDAGFMMYDFEKVAAAKEVASYFTARYSPGATMREILRNNVTHAIYDLWNANYGYWDAACIESRTQIYVVRAVLEEAGKISNGKVDETFREAIRQAFLKVDITAAETGVYGYQFDTVTQQNTRAIIIQNQMLPDPDNPGNFTWRFVYPFEGADADIVMPDPRSRGLS